MAKSPAQLEEDQAELQKWIESRRKNFPTKQRVEDKSKDQVRRQQLGMPTEASSPEKLQLSKIEIKLRKKLKLIVGQLSEGNGIKFLKNKQQYEERQKPNNRRKLGKTISTRQNDQPPINAEEEVKDNAEQQQNRRRDAKAEAKEAKK